MQTRKTAEVRRVEITEAALAIIGERGVKALTVATLAREVGVTAGALYRHFASLDEILEATVDRAVAKVEATFPPAELPPLTRLRNLAEARIAVIRENPGLRWLLLSDQVYMGVPEKAVERLRALVLRSRAFMADAVMEARANGSLRPDIEPGIVLTLFSGAVHALAGASGVHRATPGRSSGPKPADVLSTLLELLTPTGDGS